MPRHNSAAIRGVQKDEASRAQTSSVGGDYSGPRVQETAKRRDGETERRRDRETERRRDGETAKRRDGETERRRLEETERETAEMKTGFRVQGSGFRPDIAE
jgi:hypothetical protein